MLKPVPTRTGLILPHHLLEAESHPTSPVVNKISFMYTARCLDIIIIKDATCLDSFDVLLKRELDGIALQAVDKSNVLYEVCFM